MATQPFERLTVYQLAETLAGEVWPIAMGWNAFARDTVGKQVVRAADAIGANIAEGTGRGSFQDNRRFVKMARGSLYETRHWLRRAFRRKLLSEEQVTTLKQLLDNLAPCLNAYLNSIGRAESKDQGPSTEETEDDGEETEEKGPGTADATD